MTDAKQSQLKRFKEAARQLGADDDENRFNEKLRKLAKPLTDKSPSESMKSEDDES